MSGSTTGLGASGSTWTALDKIRCWIEAVAVGATMLVTSLILDLWRADLPSSLSSKLGAVAGLLLAWGLYLVARRRPVHFAAVLASPWMLIGYGGPSSTFFDALVLSLFTGLFTSFTVGWVASLVNRRITRR
jgi:hypothetical protein